MQLRVFCFIILMSFTLLFNAYAMEKEEKDKEQKTYTIKVASHEGEYKDKDIYPKFWLKEKTLMRIWDLIKPTEENNWTYKDTPVEVRLSNQMIFFATALHRHPGWMFAQGSDSSVVGRYLSPGSYFFEGALNYIGGCIHGCPQTCNNYSGHFGDGFGITYYNFILTESKLAKKSKHEKENLFSISATLTLKKSTPIITSALQKELPILKETTQKDKRIFNKIRENYPSLESKVHNVYDESTKLWVYVEPITKHNQGYFIKLLQYHGDVILRPFCEKKEQEVQLYSNVSLNENNYFKLPTLDVTHFTTKRMTFTDDSIFENEEEYNKCREHFKNECRTDPKTVSNFGNAMRGALYNIDQFEDGGTWIAYATSEAVGEQGLAMATEQNWLTSPAIKMVMTLKVSDHFYSPLGIYRNPIAIAYDQMKKNQYSSLALPFHTKVASLVKQINPNAQTMIVRPLESMANLFSQSGIPCITATSLNLINENSSMDLERDDTLEREGFNVKLDDKVLSITHKHWFKSNPFLGGIVYDDIKEVSSIYKIFPFTFIKIEDLLKWKSSKK